VKKFQLALIFCVATLFVSGLLMVFNTTSAEVLDKYLEKSPHLAFFKQLSYGLFGVLASICLYFYGYEKIIDKAYIFFYILVFLLLLVFVPGIGQEVNGAKRWIGLFGFTFQPSELAKYLLPIVLIYQKQKNEWPKSGKDFYRTMIYLSVVLGLILFEPDNGCTFILLACLCFVFLLMRIKPIYWALPLVILIIIGGVVAFQLPYVSNRMQVYLHPEMDPLGKGHQPFQSKIAAGSGGLLGKGFGESIQKLSYLPEARSDYIAAIFAEEFGFVGISMFILLYMTIAFLGFSIASNAKDKRGFYIASIFTFLLSFQAFLNFGVVSSILPSKGIALPFFSQGGTSLITNMLSIALILRVAKKSENKEEEKQELFLREKENILKEEGIL
jgi:cell division protein FtsW